MKRAVFGAVSAVALAAAAFAPVSMLTRVSAEGDPAFADVKSVSRHPNKMFPVVMSTGELDPTGVTVCAWIKSTGQEAALHESSPTASYTFYAKFFAQPFFSIEPAFATREGGAYLTNLMPFAFSVPLQLDANGDWSVQDLLPDTYDLNGMGEYAANQWLNGCYCINILTDTDVELTVGGKTKTVFASGEKQIFNMNDLTASRDVFVHAASPAAVVHLGLAENPLVHFIGDNGYYGEQTVMSSDPLSGFTGLGDEEWQFVTYRAYLTPSSNVVYRFDVFTGDNGGYSNTWRQTAMEKVHLDRNGRPAFSPHSRLAIALSSFSAITVTNDSVTVEMYGQRAYGHVLTRDELLAHRDADVRELTRRGAVFPRLNPDWWRLDGERNYTYDPVTASNEYADAASGAVGVTGANGYTTTYRYTYSVVNGPNATMPRTMENIRLSCASGTVEGADIVFPGPGTYVVTGVDEARNTRTNTTTVATSSFQPSTWFAYTDDAAGTWQRMANDAVKTNCLAAAYRGTYAYPADVKKDASFKLWNARRIPCQPHNSAWSIADAMAGANNFSAQGHRGGVHPLSAHVVASAIHYGWTIGGALRFISSDGAETGCVRTVGMEWMATNGPSWFSLAAWASTNGFTAAEAATVGDVIVHRVAEGEVPPKCRPYFMKPSVAARHFGTAGVLGWGTTQNAVGLGIPVLFGQPSNTTWFASWKSSERWPFDSSRSGTAILPFAQLVRGDVRADALALRDDWNFVMPYGGDSGLPLYIELDGRFVLVSHYKTMSSGPSYVSGHDIIKAYVESQGDELLEIEK